MRGFDAAVLHGRRVIAINKSFLLAPWADVLYFADRSWWVAHRAEALACFAGRRVSIGTCEDGILRLRSKGRCGLEMDPSGVRHGSNSGYQAINLAFHFGVSRIVLLGYDMHVDGARTHWHAGYPGHTAESQEHSLRDVFLPCFSTLVGPLAAAGVEVINCTPGSALTCWPSRALAEVLAETEVPV